MTEKTSTLAARREERLRGAFLAEERESQDRAAWVRLAALAVIGAWLLFDEDFPANLYYEALLGIFAVLGFAPVWLRRAGHSRNPQWKYSQAHSPTRPCNFPTAPRCHH